MVIVVPKGARGAFAEPFSHFTDSGKFDFDTNDLWDGISKQSSFGSESEILIQRGTRYRITKIEKAGGKWYIDVEIVSQNPLPFPYVGGYPYL